MAIDLDDPHNGLYGLLSPGSASATLHLFAVVTHVYATPHSPSAVKLGSVKLGHMGNDHGKTQSQVEALYSAHRRASPLRARVEDASDRAQESLFDESSLREYARLATWSRARERVAAVETLRRATLSIYDGTPPEWSAFIASLSTQRVRFPGHDGDVPMAMATA